MVLAVMLMLLLVLCILFIHLSVVQAWTSEQKLSSPRKAISSMRPIKAQPLDTAKTQQHHQEQSSSTVTKIPAGKSSLPSTKEQNNMEPQKLFLHFVTSLRDEAIDIFDSIAYAESNEERLENFIEVGIRHKSLIGTVAAGMALRTAIRPDASRLYGTTAQNQLRRQEAAKWGTRLGKQKF